MISTLELVPYMVGAPLMLSIGAVTYLHNTKSPSNIFMATTLTLWGLVFALFPFLFLAKNEAEALTVFRLMLLLLIFTPPTYFLSVFALIMGKKKFLHSPLTKALFALFFVFLFSPIYIKHALTIVMVDGVYHGSFSLQFAGVIFTSSLLLIVLPTIYLLQESRDLDKESRLRANGTMLAFLAADGIFVMEAFMTAFKIYRYVHLLNLIILICAYLIYYFFILRRVLYGPSPGQ